jgi:predicted nucleotidyltransferase
MVTSLGDGAPEAAAVLRPAERPDREAVIGALRRAAAEVLAPRHDVLLAYLYGSVARGQALPHSDVDVAVVLSSIPSPIDCLRLELDLEVALSAATGLDAVDVRVANAAPLLLQGAVATEGVLLFERNAAARIDFEATTRSRYFDYLPAARRMAAVFAAALSERRARSPRESRGEWPA